MALLSLPKEALDNVWSFLLYTKNRCKRQLFDVSFSYMRLQRVSSQMPYHLPKFPALFWCLLRTDYRCMHLPIIHAYHRITEFHYLSLRDAFNLIEEISIACLREQSGLRMSYVENPWVYFSPRRSAAPRVSA